MIGESWKDAVGVKVSIKQATTQDATVIMITRYDTDGKQWFAKDFVWSEYHGYDILDTSEVVVPGIVPVYMTSDATTKVGGK